LGGIKGGGKFYKGANLFLSGFRAMSGAGSVAEEFRLTASADFPQFSRLQFRATAASMAKQ
jgi:hypothetical protein